MSTQELMKKIETLATTPSASRYNPFQALTEIAKLVKQNGQRG